jgi:hypothetical protein
MSPDPPIYKYPIYKHTLHISLICKENSLFFTRFITNLLCFDRKTMCLGINKY